MNNGCLVIICALLIFWGLVLWTFEQITHFAP